METCTCCTCGYEWQKGKDGGHSCSEHLSFQVAEAESKTKVGVRNGN